MIETCSTCRFYENGQCFRLPPTFKTSTNGEQAWLRPEVKKVDPACEFHKENILDNTPVDDHKDKKRVQFAKGQYTWI